MNYTEKIPCFLIVRVDEPNSKRYRINNNWNNWVFILI